MIWFTSDTHFGHENVLKFTDRPWETIWQMNDAIVDSINGRVAVDDELYILGDFSFKMTAQDAYGLRKRIACKEELVRLFRNEILRRILHHGDLLQHHAALLLQLAVVKARPQRKIADNIHRQGQILIDYLGVVAGAILAGKGVELTADLVHLLGDLPRAARLRAVEHHMLNEMGKAVFFRPLIHGAYPNPTPDGATPDMCQFFSHDAQAVGQCYVVKHVISFPVMGSIPVMIRQWNPCIATEWALTAPAHATSLQLPQFGQMKPVGDSRPG